MTELVPRLTREGDRWDNLALEAYGDSTKSAEIIAANPTVPLSEYVPGGIYIYIPVLSKEDNTIISKELNPPWAD
jgi:hypothetical protein